MFNRLRRSTATAGFQTRSPERDFEGDLAAVAGVGQAIAEALKTFEKEEAGLKSRLDEALSRAAMTVGNDTYEHLTRDESKGQQLGAFEAEITRAQARLTVLHRHITNLKFLHAALVTRFPDSSRAG